MFLLTDAPNELKSACASTLADQFSLSAWRKFASLVIQMRPVKILISLREYAQADLNLRWAHMSECAFSDVTAQFVIDFTCWSCQLHALSNVEREKYIFSSNQRCFNFSMLHTKSPNDRGFRFLVIYSVSLWGKSSWTSFEISFK